MNISAQKVCWRVLASADEVVREAVNCILLGAHRAIAAHQSFRLVLAGGRTPKHAYQILRESKVDWRRWEIYFGDERCLPVDDTERNSTMAIRAWLEHVPIPEANIRVIPAELGPEKGASEYERTVGKAQPFDMVLLGLGEDGHTASLFPGTEHPLGQFVHPVFDAPKAPPQRISLSATALSNAAQVIVLVTGAGKRDAVRRWRGGDLLPITMVRPVSGVDVLMDAAASIDQ